MNKIQMMVIGVLALLATSPAFSQTTTNVPIGVALSLSPACNINDPTVVPVPINFPTVSNPSGQVANLDVDTGLIFFDCNQSSVTATVRIDGGNNPSGGIRRLVNLAAAGTSGQYVAYHLYDSAGRTSGSELLIGSPRPLLAFSGPTPNAPAAVVGGTDQNFTIYARIIANDVRLAAAGIFTDSLTLTLTL